MPSASSLLKIARDRGVTNISNLGSPHWRRWLGPAHRCFLPQTCFAKPLGKGRCNQWFAPVEPDLPMFFAGVETRARRSLRKVRNGETTDDLCAFLNREPNAKLAQVRPKAMPVILTSPITWKTWLTAPFEIVAKLQLPLPYGSLNAIEGPVFLFQRVANQIPHTQPRSQRIVVTAIQLG